MHTRSAHKFSVLNQLFSNFPLTTTLPIIPFHESALEVAKATKKCISKKGPCNQLANQCHSLKINKLNGSSLDAYEEVMSARHLSPEHQANGHDEDGGGDAGGHSSSHSRCYSGPSTPSRSSKDNSSGEGESMGPCYSSDFEDEANMSADQTPAAQSPSKKSGSKTSKAQKAKKSQPGLKQMKSYAVNRKALMFPVIKPLDGPKQRIQSAHVHRIKELSSQVWDLQHQLSGATTENKLLRQLQNRHMVALQHIQDSENGLPQVLAKHRNEVRVLEELLRSCRLRCSSLARKNKATEDELLHTKDSRQHLQQLSQDRSLLEREELTQRLAMVTVDHDRKDKRVQDLEKNLKLCQASFNRHIATETRKKNEATKLSLYLEEQIKQLTLEIKNRETELEINNIYSYRFPGRRNQKGKETKMVQTDEMLPLPIDTAPHSLEYPNIEEEEVGGQQSLRSWESSAIEYLGLEKAGDDRSDEDGGAGDNEKCADAGEQNGCANQENLNPQTEDDSHEDEAVHSQLVSEREQTEARDSQASRTLASVAHPNGNYYKSRRTMRHYTFKQTIQNLHSGKPAYSGLNSCHTECIPSQTRVEDLGSGAYEPSCVSLLDGGSLRCALASPQCEGEGIRSRKSNLMKDFFGQGLVLDSVSRQTNVAEGKSADSTDRLSGCHTGEAGPVFFD